MTLRAVLVDLGGTLVDFFGHMGHEPVLPLALRSTSDMLVGEGFSVPPTDAQVYGWNIRRRDPGDLRVKQLEDRLISIYGLEASEPELIDKACRAFMRPVYDQARLFEDAIPFLDRLKEQGLRAVLVSNTTWGSPAHLWREEIARHGLTPHLDAAVFCRDVGWRKPDRRIFDHATKVAGCVPEECLFVGDDPVWDIDGPLKMGMSAILVDRRMEWVAQGYQRVTSLDEITAQVLSNR